MLFVLLGTKLHVLLLMNECAIVYTAVFPFCTTAPNENEQHRMTPV
jgi:hypothetical protein